MDGRKGPEMTETELRAMIDEGKPLSEIASEMAAGEYDVCSRETLLSMRLVRSKTIGCFLRVIFLTRWIVASMQISISMT